MMTYAVDQGEYTLNEVKETRGKKIARVARKWLAVTVALVVGMVLGSFSYIQENADLKTQVAILEYQVDNK